ncbi:unnamed protein product [Adineta steineri]|uniref:SAM domain-containing protein n=1 Tax=Adineta steineri TaxID=433720 RepID=A0A819KIA7_9BILA|nr:unnamed protein product [Adineta steineri]CAF3945585.1 unnamed protein product [Adineta steineri]
MFLEKTWLNLQHHSDGRIKTPEELEGAMSKPPKECQSDIFDRIHGSMIGMALGDALGAHVEFRPHEFLVENPVETLEGGGTWGLKKGQFTDDTSMALCLASSLIVRQDYDPYDQLVRYKWWFREGYMSSTGKCFDIGAATKHSLLEFERRQANVAKKYRISSEALDLTSDPAHLIDFDVKCSTDGVAGNGALMRLAPVPLFFYQHPVYAVEYSGHSGEITHGDQKAYDACRYYGALIVAAVRGETKEDLLDDNFYDKHIKWFDSKPLHPDVERIARGSYKKAKGYDGGIRGKGYIVSALEAALWAFWSDDPEESFKEEVLAAINLGDDTDTTAAIYGQLAGACYGYKKLPKWKEEIYAKEFIKCLSQWIAYEGTKWSPKKLAPLTNPSLTVIEEDGRPRRKSSVSATLQPPGLEEHTNHNRPKSAEQRNLGSQPQRIYNHGKIKTTDDVCHWLEHFGKEYKAYASTFKKHNIDGYWLINHIDSKNLTEYGVEEAHQQTIFNGIKKLKEECPVQFATVLKN